MKDSAFHLSFLPLLFILLVFYITFEAKTECFVLCFHRKDIFIYLLRFLKIFNILIIVLNKGSRKLSTVSYKEASNKRNILINMGAVESLRSAIGSLLPGTVCLLDNNSSFTLGLVKYEAKIT